MPWPTLAGCAMINCSLRGAVGGSVAADRSTIEGLWAVAVGEGPCGAACSSAGGDPNAESRMVESRWCKGRWVGLVVPAIPCRDT